MSTGSIRIEPRLDEVKRELQAIIDSPVFSHSVRQTKMLEYLCNKVLLGEADHIKATTIAMEVFGRQWDFDDSKDAIVRVEAHRLRRKLAKYYEGEGAKSHLRIVLAPGRYVPEFTINEAHSITDLATSPGDSLGKTLMPRQAPHDPCPTTPHRPMNFRISAPQVTIAVSCWSL